MFFTRSALWKKKDRIFRCLKWIIRCDKIINRTAHIVPNGRCWMGMEHRFFFISNVYDLSSKRIRISLFACENMCRYHTVVSRWTRKRKQRASTQKQNGRPKTQETNKQTVIVQRLLCCALFLLRHLRYLHLFYKYISHPKIDQPQHVWCVAQRGHFRVWWEGEGRSSIFNR